MPAKLWPVCGPLVRLALKLNWVASPSRAVVTGAPAVIIKPAAMSVTFTNGAALPGAPGAAFSPPPPHPSKTAAASAVVVHFREIIRLDLMLIISWQGSLHALAAWQGTRCGRRPIAL
ncbi:MAG TPA: hypothetical protein VFL86_25555 [Burkholderiaceae bacterium]|nr:hypothetical protein [Burkholderiaceae bacterium]